MKGFKMTTNETETTTAQAIAQALTAEERAALKLVNDLGYPTGWNTVGWKKYNTQWAHLVELGLLDKNDETGTQIVSELGLSVLAALALESGAGEARPTVITAADFVAQDYAGKIERGECEVWLTNYLMVSSCKKTGAVYTAFLIDISEYRQDKFKYFYEDQQLMVKYPSELDKALPPQPPVAATATETVEPLVISEAAIKQLEKMGAKYIGDDTEAALKAQDTERQDLANLLAEIKQLQFENAALRQRVIEAEAGRDAAVGALEFYASDDAYVIKSDTDFTCTYTDVERDDGQKARKALESVTVRKSAGGGG